MQISDIPSFCVVVGANGSGKSTLFDVFGFLKDSLAFNVARAIQSRGGFRELVARDHERESISIEIQFRTIINNVDRLVTYQIDTQTNKNGRPVIEHEVLRYKRGAYGSPFHFLDFHHGEGFAIINEEAFDKADEKLHRDYQKVDPDILAIKGLGLHGLARRQNSRKYRQPDALSNAAEELSKLTQQQ